MNNLVLFEQKQVRRQWNEADQKWYFAIVDVVGVLTDSVNAGAYWRKLKERLRKEGNESVTDCHALKMTAADGKQRMTDVADAEQLFRLIQSVPSPKAEPFKRWLAKVGYERLQEIENPELATQRVREVYRLKPPPQRSPATPTPGAFRRISRPPGRAARWPAMPARNWSGKAGGRFRPGITSRKRPKVSGGCKIKFCRVAACRRSRACRGAATRYKIST
jgi:hypothetical protein